MTCVKKTPRKPFIYADFKNSDTRHVGSGNTIPEPTCLFQLLQLLNLEERGTKFMATTGDIFLSLYSKTSLCTNAKSQQGAEERTSLCTEAET